MRRRLFYKQDDSNKHTLYVVFYLTDESVLDFELRFSSRNNSKVFYINGNTKEKTEIFRGTLYKLNDLFANYTYFELYTETEFDIELEIEILTKKNNGHTDISSQAFRIECYTQSGTYETQNQRFEYTIKSDEGIIQYSV